MCTFRNDCSGHTLSHRYGAEQSHKRRHAKRRYNTLLVMRYNIQASRLAGRLLFEPIRVLLFSLTVCEERSLLLRPLLLSGCIHSSINILDPGCWLRISVLPSLAPTHRRKITTVTQAA